MISQFFAWYLVVQLITLVSLPLAARLFANLADRGYALTKSLGILLVGLVLWLGTSYGLLRNEVGGAWLALVVVAAASLTLGRSAISAWRGQLRRSANLVGVDDEGQAGLAPSAAPEAGGLRRFSWRYILVIEWLFLLAFVAWAYVRAHDPAANHTEKPMDLMFMNSIWQSPTYPPHDAWLSGYAISYYYLGYWLLTTLGRLSGQPPEIAFSLGQACWFALLLINCVGVVYNLLRHAQSRQRSALTGGLLAALMVGVAGNLQGLFEWLYANGVDVTGIANWFAVDGFPENAVQTGHWYIGFDWWWWRSSRVIEDLDLLGQHIEVIDEFPIFSYILGDNHPHVLAMPFVLLVIGLLQNLFFKGMVVNLTSASMTNAQGGLNHGALLDELHPSAFPLYAFFRTLQRLFPLGAMGFLLLVVATGSLVFFNTWDFPPYWLLLVLAVWVVLLQNTNTEGSTRLKAFWRATGLALGLGGLTVLLIGIIYLPYFLTAQSQAGGIVPNLFNPTRFPQFFLMFGPALAGLLALLALSWPTERVARYPIVMSLAVVYGAPLLFLLLGAWMALNTEAGRQLLQRMALPTDTIGYGQLIVQRWLSQGLTFLLVGGLLALVAWLCWRTLWQDKHQVDEVAQHNQQTQLFALLLTLVGLLLVYGPEFVFLRDNFGTRMNTIFKFYYQAWLLFGLSGSYAVVRALTTKEAPPSARGLALLTLLLLAFGMIYPVTATYSKTNGFASAEPTFDATAYIARESPDEFAAIEWLRRQSPPTAVMVEGKGASYRANYSRISATTGRSTLLGWDGHESQWRGSAYGEMAQGRAEALDQIYRNGSAEQIQQALTHWGIDYVYVGPTEYAQYGMTPQVEARLAQVMDLVFEQGSVRIYQRRK
jgi:YYY domain-containing protein